MRRKQYPVRKGRNVIQAPLSVLKYNPGVDTCYSSWDELKKKGEKMFGHINNKKNPELKGHLKT